MTTHENIKDIIASLNNRINECVRQGIPFDQIRYSVAGWAEYFATEMFDTTMEEIDPELAALLHRIKAQGGKLERGDCGATTDYGLMLPLDPWKIPEGGA